jgi:hypothetical protein
MPSDFLHGGFQPAKILGNHQLPFSFMMRRAHGNSLHLKTIRLGPLPHFARIIISHKDVTSHLLQNFKQIFMVNFPVAVEATGGFGVWRIHKKNRVYVILVFFYQGEAVFLAKSQLFLER